MKTFIIAEAGVNHNGNPDLAFELVEKAAWAGADAVKFQTFKANSIALADTEKADYQKKTTGADESQLSMLQRLELSYELHHALAEHCQKHNIRFLSTAFDLESLEFLTQQLDLRLLKLPSGEITNGPLILAHARTKADLIISTGMATLGEIEAALAIVAFAFTDGREPSTEAFAAALQSRQGRQALREKVTLLHCTSEYPAPLPDINLRAMRTLGDAFDVPVGYSDHSQGIGVPLAAAALGARVIEKHFTLDKTLPGPDHVASLEPDELKAMVNGVRDVQTALGDAVKAPQASEFSNRRLARKSLVARRPIRRGELFTAENLTTKRPGAGRSPMAYWDLIGTPSRRDYAADELIE